MDFFKDKNELAPFVNLRSDVGFTGMRKPAAVRR
ncbi:unknown [Alistipes sp. CAG:435]|nr:unknown [Alistipes sp. CAG:435]